jgi:hypothetical protein
MALSRKDLMDQDEFWIFLFFLGAALLNWPVLSLATEGNILGLPSILVYINGVWLVLILFAFLFDRRHPG